MKLDFIFFITTLSPLLIWFVSIVISWVLEERLLNRRLLDQRKESFGIIQVKTGAEVERDHQRQLIEKFETTPPQAHSWMYESDTKQLFDRR